MMWWIVLGLIGCQETSLTNNTWTDVFKQRRTNAVDLLVVVDNSCSMAEEQDNLASNFDSLIDEFVAAEVDWQVAVTTTDVEADRYRGQLMSGDDEIILSGPGGELDRVQYDRTWGFAEGVSLQLDAGALTTWQNDSATYWCASTESFGEQQGSPGELNGDCGLGNPPFTAPPGPDQGPRAPGAGDVVISEIMATSSGPDAQCEWFELTNTTSDTLDISGFDLRDEGRNRATIGSATTIPPGTAVVVGRDPEACGARPSIIVSAGLTLNDTVSVLTPDTDAAAELFSEQVAQGTIGSGIELGLEAARLSFDPQYYGVDHPEWVREEASLAILVVSDEDDLSPLSVPNYLRAFAEFKGDRALREPGWFTLSAVVGTTLPPNEEQPACVSENGEGWYGARYLDAANQTGGLTASICEDDFAPIVAELGLTLSGLEAVFALSRTPAIDSLSVRLYADESEASLLSELEKDVDYSYDPVDNVVRFDNSQIPPSETYIAVQYVVVPDSASPGESP